MKKITFSSLDACGDIKTIFDKPISAYSITFNVKNLNELIKRRGIEDVIKNAQIDIESSIRMINEADSQQ